MFSFIENATKSMIKMTEFSIFNKMKENHDNRYFLLKKILKTKSKTTDNHNLTGRLKKKTYSCILKKTINVQYKFYHNKYLQK